MSEIRIREIIHWIDVAIVMNVCLEIRWVDYTL